MIHGGFFAAQQKGDSMTFHPDYTRLSLFGEGGYGTVFLAQEKEKGILVAIKQSQLRWYSLEHEW